MNPYVTGTVIKELREKCHLTQAELADKLGVSDKTINRWEAYDIYWESGRWILYPYRTWYDEAALSSEKIQMIKLYAEGNAEARVKINGVKKILFYCNRDGLFMINVLKGIDDKQSSYEDTKERRELEAVAKKILG